MKPTLYAVCMALLLSPVAFAADAEKKPTAQQMRMKECNQKAEGMKGEERKGFMSECLAGKEPQGKMTQQERMTECNRKAGDQKGEERKSFMSECLKG